MPTWKNEYLFKVPKGKFRMLTGRHAQFTQTSTSNNSALHDLMYYKLYLDKYESSKRMKIEFGDEVEVSSLQEKQQSKHIQHKRLSLKLSFSFMDLDQRVKLLLGRTKMAEAIML